MPKKIGKARREAMIEQIVDAQHDWVQIAKQNHLGPDDLAAWAEETANRQTLQGLCRLADLQAQVLLGRCKLIAAGRLLELATATDESANPEIARKACVDLLKLGEKPDEPQSNSHDQDKRSSQSRPADVASLRTLLYGDEANSQTTHGPRQEKRRPSQFTSPHAQRARSSHEATR